MKLVNKLIQSYPLMMRWVHFEPTWRCNLRCIHCIVGGISSDTELTTQEIKELIPQLKELGCFRIVISGGEPFIRTDILEIIRSCFKQDFTVTLLTNATLLNKRILRYLIDRPVSLQVSLYGSNPQVHERITQVKGSFERAMDSIRLLKRTKVSFHIAFPVMKENLEDVEDMYLLGRNLGVEVRFPMLLYRKLNFDPAPKGHMLSWSQMGVLFTKSPFKGDLKRVKLSSRERAQRIKEAIDSVNFCFIAPCGEVYAGFLSDIPAGNLRRERLATIWQGSKVFRWLRTLAPQQFECYHCTLLDICCPNFEEAYFERHNIFRAPKACCRIVNSLLKARKGGEDTRWSRAIRPPRNDTQNLC